MIIVECMWPRIYLKACLRVCYFEEIVKDCMYRCSNPVKINFTDLVSTFLSFEGWFLDYFGRIKCSDGSISMF